MDYFIDNNGLSEARKDTVNEILELLIENNKVCCIRYTGFGKSYYVVPELINKLDGKVLILVPSKPLLEQYREQFALESKVEISTYQGLLRKVKTDKCNVYSNIKYIICDECHHLGKNLWRDALDTLVKSIEAKVIGITATQVRGDSIDVVKNYFNGVQTETIELLDGINRGFLPKIKYVVAYSQVDEINNEKINEVDKYKIQNLINIPNILGKYIDEDRLKGNLKVLVYVPNVKYINEAIYQCREWFKCIYPDKNINMYNIHSYRKRSLNEKVLSEFRQNNSENDIDIMVSVDMLTEGLHLPAISVELMLRKTASPVIYFQQLGRVINSVQPIVFDLINNSNHLYQIQREYDEGMEYTIKHRGVNRGILFDECVELIDETTEIEDILSKYRHYKKERLSTADIDNIILKNIRYIENNPDGLSFNKMSKYLNISPHSLQDAFERLNIKFDYYKYKKIIVIQEKFILNNKEYIEEKSGVMSYRELAQELQIPDYILRRCVSKYNIKFKSDVKVHRTLSQIDAIIKDNIDNINKWMSDGVSLDKQANNLDLSFIAYKNALVRNNVNINYLWQKFEDKYDLDEYKQFVDLYKTDMSKADIIAKLNITDKLYLAYVRRAVKDGNGRSKLCVDYSKRLTASDKEFIRDNYTKYTNTELSEILNKPRQAIKDWKKNNGFVDKSRASKPLTDKQKQQIINLFKQNNGISFIQIGKQVGCSDKGVRGYLEKQGLHHPKSPKVHTEDDIFNIRNDYIAGMTKVELETKYHIGHKVLNGILDDISVSKVTKRKIRANVKYDKMLPSILEDYNKGMSKSNLIKKYHIGMSKLNELLSKGTNL